MLLAMAAEQTLGWPVVVLILAVLVSMSFVAWALFRPAKVTVYQCTKCGNCSEGEEEHP